MSTHYRDAYNKINDLLRHSLENSNLVLVSYDESIANDKLSNLRKGNLIYNTNDPFLGRRKQCVVIDHNTVSDEVDVVYEYAVNLDIAQAPKTAALGVTIKQSKYWL